METPSNERLAMLADGMLRHAQKTCEDPSEACAVFALCIAAMMKDERQAHDVVSDAFADLHEFQQ